MMGGQKGALVHRGHTWVPEGKEETGCAAFMSMLCRHTQWCGIYSTDIREMGAVMARAFGG
jgi:hypothetical protein